MSDASDRHERNVAKAFRGQILPEKLPKWMKDEGYFPGDKVLSSDVIGGTGVKTDVIVTFENSPNLRISVKMSNATFSGILIKEY